VLLVETAATPAADQHRLLYRARAAHHPSI